MLVQPTRNGGRVSSFFVQSKPSFLIAASSHCVPSQPRVTNDATRWERKTQAWFFFVSETARGPEIYSSMCRCMFLLHASLIFPYRSSLKRRPPVRSWKAIFLFLYQSGKKVLPPSSTLPVLSLSLFPKAGTVVPFLYPPPPSLCYPKREGSRSFFMQILAFFAPPSLPTSAAEKKRLILPSAPFICSNFYIALPPNFGYLAAAPARRLNSF